MSDYDQFGAPKSPEASPVAHRHEPAVQLPLAVSILLVVHTLAELLVPLASREALIGNFGLFPRDMFAGEVELLLTSMFVHGSFEHIAMNMAGLLAFGAPVARLLGQGRVGIVSFILFYLVAGILAGLGYSLLHAQSAAPVIGASGAVSALMGAAMRVMSLRGETYQPRDIFGLLHPWNPRVLSLSAGWILINILLGVLPPALTSGGSPIAWEAHVIGYCLGWWGIGLWARLFSALHQRNNVIIPPTQDPLS